MVNPQTRKQQICKSQRMTTMANQNEVERLFELYSSNLSTHDPSFKDTFVCPLCFRSFTRDAIQSHGITVEHIIPESIGGKLKTLTCQKCNSLDGAVVDAHLVQRIRTEDKLAGKSNKPLRAKVVVDKGEFNADIYLSNDEQPNIQIVGLPELSNPRLHKLAEEEFIVSKGAELTIKGRLGYKEIPSRVAIIRSAYLMMFRYFGYGYIIYDVAEPLRAQIANPNEETEILKGIVRLNRLPPEVKQAGIGILNQPENLRCFFVLLDLSTDVKRQAGVVIPGLDPESKNIYKRWADFGPEKIVGMNNSTRLIPYNRDFVSNPALKSLPVYFWQGRV